MRSIITADLHLTGRPEDAYRFEFFDWLHDQRFDALVILGDLTDEKDYHASWFVNKVVEQLLSFAESHEVHILMGNHDYTDPLCPFFEFFKHYPNCYYHSTPEIWELGNQRWAFYPHSRKPEGYFSDMIRGKELDVSFTLCHQIFHGAESESGRKLRGCSVEGLHDAGKIFSGDVHVPQVIGSVEYVGAPYPIRFGDVYEPRVVMVDGERWSYLSPPHIQKMVLRIKKPGDIEYCPGWNRGDQVKVVLTLPRSEFSHWDEYRRDIRKICDRNRLMLCGLELEERKRARLNEFSTGKISVVPKDQFEDYCRCAKVDASDIEYGRKLLGT